MVAARAMVLSAIADIEHGICRPRTAARRSARSAAPARSHRQPQQTDQHDSHNRDLQCRRGHELSFIRMSGNTRHCAPQKRPASAAIGRQIWRFRSLIIQAECGTLAAQTALFAMFAVLEKGEAMKKTLMALAAVSTLAVSAVVAPAPAHAQRGVGAAIAGGLIGGAIVGGALAGPGYTVPAIMVRAMAITAARPMSLIPVGCYLAAAAVLGRLWLAGAQRKGLRLRPFTFIKSTPAFPETPRFRERTPLA